MEKKERVRGLMVKKERAKCQTKKPPTKKKGTKVNLQKKIMKKAKGRLSKKKIL